MISYRVYSIGPGGGARFHAAGPGRDMILTIRDLLQRRANVLNRAEHYYVIYPGVEGYVEWEEDEE